MSDLGKIEVDLASLVGTSTDEYSLRQAIVDAAVDRLVADEARSAFRERVRKVTDEQIVMHLRPLLKQAVEEAVKPTDRFGTPKSETPVTLREYIVDIAKRHLLLEGREGYRHLQKTELEKFLTTEVDRALKAQMKDAIDEEIKAVGERVRGEMASIFAEALKRSIRL